MASPESHEDTENTYNGYSMQDLRNFVPESEEPSECASTLMEKLYTAEELASHSPSGKKSSNNTGGSVKREKFEPHRYGAMSEILMEKFPTRITKRSDITASVQRVIKKYQYQARK